MEYEADFIDVDEDATTQHADDDDDDCQAEACREYNDEGLKAGDDEDDDDDDDDDVEDEEMAIDESFVVSSSTDQLERCGKWLASIPRDDIAVLRQTQEYHDVLRALRRLGHAHRRVLSMNRSSLSLSDVGAVPLSESDRVEDVALSSLQDHKIITTAYNNFLQHLTADDVILRIFEFLECQSLIRTSMTCSRFRQLSHRSATQRTYDVANARQLNNVMQLLRAKEQIDGVGTGIHDSHVRVPILLLSRRVLVSDAGDPEYNGVYFCTGSNGNGFVFTKPRFPEQRVQRSAATQRAVPTHSTPLMAAAAAGNGLGGLPIMPAEAAPRARFESEVAQPGQLLRCIIAKRFSNETILWYLSKEVEATETRDGVRAGEVTQVFAFWAKLMVIGDASPDICRYPSQSSILSRHNEGWQALSTTRTTRPPTVELLD